MTSKAELSNVSHRHSLTIDTNPLHLLPSNIRRFSHEDSLENPTTQLPTVPETPVKKNRFLYWKNSPCFKIRFVKNHFMQKL
ncbi:hypothetical protein DICVIV_01748 [Dictyocaulus viviparus]|uniref:Uncharacterized protein n=1 Tax=Dictyocaulus viviparus TaxID=29172 RepID=A0A0D8Y765_DICVI|nr:hypothetical protein DICVIV_01748 [Dictyocaulus viviparus]